MTSFFAFVNLSFIQIQKLSMNQKQMEMYDIDQREREKREHGIALSE